MLQSALFGYPNSEAVTNHSGEWCNPSWTGWELIGTYPLKAGVGFHPHSPLLSRHLCLRLRDENRTDNTSIGSRLSRSGRRRLWRAIHVVARAGCSSSNGARTGPRQSPITWIEAIETELQSRQMCLQLVPNFAPSSSQADL